MDSINATTPNGAFFISPLLPYDIPPRNRSPRFHTIDK